MLISFLMGHSLQGVSAKYTNELMIANSEALRTAQEKISRRIFELLALAPGANPTIFDYIFSPLREGDGERTSRRHISFHPADTRKYGVVSLPP